MASCSRLARLMKALLLLQAAAAIGWCAWRWPAAPGEAVVGAIAIAMLGPLGLALEFLLLPVVQRADRGVPVPRPLQLLRAWVAETLLMFRVFYGRMAFRWREPPDQLSPACAGRRGVVFIHGFVCNRGFWSPWMRRLQGTGHAFVAVNLEPLFVSIESYTALVEAAVQRVTACTGEPPLVVCHSMGGLVARSWLRATHSASRVAHVVTIGSPHRGTWLGRFSRRTQGRQMQLRSDWLAALAHHEASVTPPPFTCWYTNCDNVVFPASTATLPHADNRFVPGRAHVELAFEPDVIGRTLALLLDAPGAPLSR
jgi:pimeloyl-ACP methyl ester carboxylesterase